MDHERPTKVMDLYDRLVMIIYRAAITGNEEPRCIIVADRDRVDQFTIDNAKTSVINMEPKCIYGTLVDADRYRVLGVSLPENGFGIRMIKGQCSGYENTSLGISISMSNVSVWDEGELNKVSPMETLDRLFSWVVTRLDPEGGKEEQWAKMEHGTSMPVKRKEE